MKYVFLLLLATLVAFSSASASEDVENVIQGVFKAFSISVDVKTCVKDADSFGVALEESVELFEKKQVSLAVDRFAVSLHMFSQSVKDCQVPTLATKVEQLAKLFGISKIKYLDQAVQIVVKSTNLYDAVEKLFNDYKNKDTTSFGYDLQALIQNINQLVNCTTRGCQLMEKILEDAAQIAIDYAPCKQALEDVANDMDHFAYKQDKTLDTVGRLDKTLHDLSGAIAQCHVEDLAKFIGDQATKLGADGKVTVHWTGIFINDVNIITEIVDLANDWKNGNYAAAAGDVTQLLAKVHQSACTTTACYTVDGILRALGLVAQDMGSCKTDLEKAVTQFEAAASSMRSYNYHGVIQNMGAALNELAQGIKECHLPEISALIEEEAKRISGASVQIGGTVKIIVNDADIFQDIYGAIMAFEQKDWGTFGMRLGSLLQRMQQTSCTTEGCYILEGLLQSMQIVASDMGECKADLVAAVGLFNDGVSSFKSKDYRNAVTNFATGLDKIAIAVADCHLTESSQFIQTEAEKLHLGNVSWLGKAVKIVVYGADVYEDVFDTVMAFEHKDLSAAGQSLGDLLSKLHISNCTEPACVVLDALVKSLQAVAGDYTMCKGDLTTAMDNFQNMSTNFQAKNYLAAVKSLSRGLDEIALAVRACNVQELSTILTAAANSLGFHDIKAIGDITHILVDGSNIYDELFQAVMSFERKDYHGFGDDLGNAIMGILSWRSKSGCDSKACYFVSGMMQAFNILEGNIKQCEADLEGSFHSFETAVKVLVRHESMKDASNMKRLPGHVQWDDVNATPEMFIYGTESFKTPSFRANGWGSWWDSAKKAFKTIEKNVKQDIKKDWAKLEGMFSHHSDDGIVKEGLSDMAKGLDQLAHAVEDCEVEQLVKVMTALAAKLGVPVAGWLSEAFNIIINGAQIYDDVYNAVMDYEAHNYFGMGYEVAKLAIKLVEM
eukprot:TRINITY_DN7711_c0_g1_i1.p1 TRINITY_DN7711_c0_g1~~TRINITY_DN7711_c0_g1_i1.p1  ORF type:complete len:950 (+),score=285.81 TRINITY_DN7711_c0_g1_i1:122-2971(+)